MRRPNVFMIMTDQQRFDHLGLMGMKGIATPNLDRLGKEGVCLTRAYTSSPTCTPARVTLLTGQYPSSHGAYSIGVSADPFPKPTIGELFRQAGYKTALFGKTHFVCREDESRHVSGLEDRFSDAYRDFDGPYVGFEKVRASTGHTINQKPDMHYRIFLEDSGEDYKQWFPQFHPEYDHNRCGPWEIPAKFHDTAWVGGLTENWIRRQNNEQPWLCWANFQDPHEPFVCPEEWYNKVDRRLLQPFEGRREGEFDDKPAFYKSAADGDWSEFDDGNGVPSSFYTPQRDERALDALQATVGMIGFIDDRIGAMLNALEETGQLDNTIVIFTSDHGEMHGHHGFWGKGLTAYDDCQRIPLLIWGPGYFQGRGKIDSLVNLVDVPQTLLTYAGIEIPLHMQGENLKPLLEAQTDSIRKATIIECQATQNVYQQTLITEQYKLIVYRDSDDGELYDMQADPDQYTNLWNLPAYQKRKAELMILLVQTQMKKEGKVNARKAFA